MVVTKSAPSRIVLVHSHEYAKWVISETHPTQGRRFDIAATHTD